jgi:MFS family permease
MSEAIARKAGRKEWIGLIIIALPCIVYAMDLTVLNLAIPHLSADLKPRNSELLWIIDIYGFMVAGLLITMGTLGDKIGRRKLLMVGATAFSITSVLAFFATSATMLIAARHCSVLPVQRWRRPHYHSYVICFLIRNNGLLVCLHTIRIQSLIVI